MRVNISLGKDTAIPNVVQVPVPALHILGDIVLERAAERVDSTYLDSGSCNNGDRSRSNTGPLQLPEKDFYGRWLPYPRTAELE